MAVQRLKINAYSCAWYKWHFFLFISSLSMTAGAVTAKSPAERLLGKFGTNYSMNAAQIADLFDKMGISNWDYDGSKEEVKFFRITAFIATILVLKYVVVLFWVIFWCSWRSTYSSYGIMFP